PCFRGASSTASSCRPCGRSPSDGPGSRCTRCQSRSPWDSSRERCGALAPRPNRCSLRPRRPGNLGALSDTIVVRGARADNRLSVAAISAISDDLRLRYARFGVPHCPNCGKLITRQTPQQIVDRVLQLPDGTRFQVLAPVVRGRKGEYHALLDELAGQGYTRA